MKLYTSFNFAKPALDLLTTRNGFVLPIKEDQCSLPNEKEMKKQKEKERRKRELKAVTLCLEPEHSPRGIWRKPLKPGALNLHWLGVIDFVFATRVDGWSLASCRCLILKIIQSPG